MSSEFLHISFPWFEIDGRAQNEKLVQLGWL